MKTASAVFGEGRYTVTGTAALCGQDVSLSFTGGTLPHIGAVSLAVYEPQRRSATVSTVTVYGHRDDCLSAACAKEAAARLRCTASVSVGIHIDSASPEEIRLLADNFSACSRLLLDQAERLLQEDPIDIDNYKAAGN